MILQYLHYCLNLKVEDAILALQKILVNSLKMHFLFHIKSYSVLD